MGGYFGGKLGGFFLNSHGLLGRGKMIPKIPGFSHRFPDGKSGAKAQKRRKSR